MAHRLSEDARGVYIISATPFTDTGAIDHASLDKLTDFYLGSGVDGITILGVMGEAPKLTNAEAQAVLTQVLRRVDGRVPVIVGVSNPGLGNMVDLAKIAMGHGAADVMVAPSAAQKTEPNVIALFESIAQALPDVPLVYQDFPLTTSVPISAGGFTTLVERVPSVVMLKHEDWPGLPKLSAVRATAETRGARRVSILCGNGGLYLP